MSEIQKYIDKIKKFKIENPDLTDLELIRYVYLDLGNRFSFDDKAYLGNGQEKAEIYYRVRDENDELLEEIMQKRIAICKEIAYSYVRIFHKVISDLSLNFSVYAQSSPDDDYHIYNIIVLDDNRKFSIDIQRDIPFIKTNSRTRFFGLRIGDENAEPVISRDELEEIDKKIGYISDEKYYSDEYYDLLKYNSDGIKDFGEKVDFIFENIMIYDNEELKFFDRMMYLIDVFNSLFTQKEINHIHFIDCYYEDDEEKDYQVCIEVEVHGKPVLYRFSYEDMKYHKISVYDFAREINNGLKMHNKSKNIKGLKDALRRVKEADNIKSKNNKIDIDER